MDLNKKNIGLIMIPLFAIIALTGCGVSVKYTFSGASTTGLNTVSVLYFQNRASLVQPTLSQNITDALIDKCKAQTKLKIVSSAGDASFEGYITEYSSKPFTSSANQAATNRFTISVKVKFVNNVDPDKSYDQNFTRYEDYSSTLDFSSIEAEKSEEIIKLLVEDIFNRAFVNWE